MARDEQQRACAIIDHIAAASKTALNGRLCLDNGDIVERGMTEKLMTKAELASLSYLHRAIGGTDILVSKDAQ
jgi:hypothetical protein